MHSRRQGIRKRISADLQAGAHLGRVAHLAVAGGFGGLRGLSLIGAWPRLAARAAGADKESSARYLEVKWIRDVLSPFRPFLLSCANKVAVCLTETVVSERDLCSAGQPKKSAGVSEADGC